MIKKTPYNILAVDDAKDTLMILEFDLVEEGYNVITADSGEQALEIIDEQAIDLILLDMYMPGISGLSVLQKLKADPTMENTPVIMLSASNDEDQIVAALEFGADDYVTKPYIAKVLLARMRTSLRLLEKNQQLEALAKTDFLTGLNNRGCFNELANKAINQAKRGDFPLVIAMMDIDLFKNVNDNYGHEAGDNALISFAEIMKECFRNYDILGRIGGEEFAICMPNTSTNDAVKACERFRLAIEEQPIYLDDDHTKQIFITVSIGLTTATHENFKFEQLLKIADSGLYQAKEQGRNQVVVIPPKNESNADNQFLDVNVNDFSNENINIISVNEPMSENIDSSSTDESFPGIDYSIGVNNVLGDKSLFEDILVMFLDDHGDDVEKIAQAIELNDQEACKHLVHTLKGVACSVGAMTLFEKSKKLDEVINLHQQSEYQRLFLPVSEELNLVVKGIKQALASKINQ